jgi:hypothetical protein
VVPAEVPAQRARPSSRCIRDHTGGTSGGTRRDKDEEIRVRMGNSDFSPDSKPVPQVACYLRPVLKAKSLFGFPVWTRFELLRPKAWSARTLEPLQLLLDQ